MDKSMQLNDTHMVSSISVIIVAINRKNFLKEAVYSALRQTLSNRNYEVIVVKNFEDREIDSFLYVNHVVCIQTDDEHYGRNLEMGLTAARGDIICFLEDDDMFTENKLEVVIEKFETDSNLIYMHNSYFTIDERGNQTRKDHLNCIKRSLLINDEMKEKDSMKIASYSFNTSCVTIRKTLLTEQYLKLISKETFTPDFLILLIALASKGHILMSSDRLNYYRYHNSFSHLIIQSNDLFVAEYGKRFSESAKLHERLIPIFRGTPAFGVFMSLYYSTRFSAILFGRKYEPIIATGLMIRSLNASFNCRSSFFVLSAIQIITLSAYVFYHPFFAGFIHWISEQYTLRIVKL